MIFREALGKTRMKWLVSKASFERVEDSEIQA